MSEEKRIRSVEVISALVGIFSIILTIYLTKNVALQIAFATTIAISIIILFLFNNYNTINSLIKENKLRAQEVSLLKENLEIYNRLNKLENKVSR